MKPAIRIDAMSPTRAAGAVLAHVLARAVRRGWRALVRHSLRLDIAMHERRCDRYRAKRERAAAQEQIALFDRALSQSRLRKLSPSPVTKESP